MAAAKAQSLRRMKWGKALILLNGDLGNPGAVRRLVRSGATLICADGGARHAAKLGLEPRLVIGDADSIPHKLLARWKRAVYLFDDDQDASDFEKALRFAARRGIRTLWVAGALGGRLDHELVNLALMERYSETLNLSLADRGASILGPGRYRIPCRKGRALTLLPATPQALVTVSGVKYPLRREVLTRSSRGLSNAATSSSIRLQIHSGRLWIIMP